MYTLEETWNLNYRQPPTTNWDGKMICVELDAQMTFKANKTQGYSLHYSFTLITQGWLTIIYNGRELTLRPNDLYIYSPGLSINIISASKDYNAVSVLVDEKMALEIPTVRNLISIAYQPVLRLSEPKLALPADVAHHLECKFREMIDYFNSEHIYKSQVLQLLFSVLMLDIVNIQGKAISSRQIPQRMEALFINFLRLLPAHFIKHHDILFYADQLHISTAYLSRIVKRITGRTVVDYINQMLAMEAAFLLQTSSLSVAQIADRLHFADTPSFSKFFSRMKGISPREFRENM